MARNDFTQGTEDDFTKEELYEEAGRLEIEGRSSMNKAELFKAIRDADTAQDAADGSQPQAEATQVQAPADRPQAQQDPNMTQAQADGLPVEGSVNPGGEADGLVELDPNGNPIAPAGAPADQVAQPSPQQPNPSGPAHAEAGTAAPGQTSVDRDYADPGLRRMAEQSEAVQQQSTPPQ